jgi:hypothetical protein
MPLIKSKSPAAVGKNISKLKSEGYTNPKQRVAIALSTARKAGADIPPPKKRRKVAGNLSDMMMNQGVK